MAYPNIGFHFSSSTSILFLILFQIFTLPIASSLSSTTSSPLVLKHQHQSHHSSKRHPTKPAPNLQPNQTHTTACNLFIGSWVQDDTYPMYQSSNCPLIDPEFNCQLYGRPDSNYLRYRWKPTGCDLPRFDGLTFLSRMQGKTVMFVGDSLGRNQWESLICMISAAVPQSPTQILKHDPLSAFKFLEYGVTISFYRTPYLVDIDLIQGKRILRLDNIPSNIGNVWKDADVVSFNSGHWWSHKGELQGWDFMETGGSIYQDMDRLVAFEKGLRTWATWVDANIDTTRTRVFFQGISPVHYNPREWNPSSYTKNKNCYGETEPVSGEVYPGPYPDQMKVLQSVISNLKTVPAYLLDITTLSELRKDGHPSIYGGNLSSDQRANPERSSDCSHWCLPGPPDTWNQLFYTAMFF